MTRSQLSAAARASAARALTGAVAAVLDGLPPGPVAAYASVGTEPGTRGLLAALHGCGRPVLLPLLLPDGDLDWAEDDGHLVPGPLGLLQPSGRALGRSAVADCPLLVVPALAVDRSGTRLGRGGGSYDRALARTTGLVVAALHRGELVERLPAQPHDRPVHAAVEPGAGLVPLRLHPALLPAALLPSTLAPGAFPPAAGPGGMGP